MLKEGLILCKHNMPAYFLFKDQPIHPDDQILIDGKLPEEIRIKMNETNTSQTHKEDRPVTQRPSSRPDPKDIPWLRKFDYLTGEINDEAPKQVSKPRKIAFLEDEENVDTATRILETFKPAQTLPKHPTKPELAAEEIYEVFPNFDFWPKNYHSVIFERDPEVPGTLEEQKIAKDKAILKNYPRSTTNLSRDLLVYLVPKTAQPSDIPERETKAETTQELSNETELEWIRTYNVDLKNRDTPECQDLFLFSLHGEKANYNPILSRFSLQRTPVVTLEKFFKTINQPEKITVSPVEVTAEKKQREQKNRLDVLYPPG